jgi:hypothetical protein
MLMTTRRQDLLKQLEEAAVRAEPIDLLEQCSAIGFQVIYGLPWELQIRAACHMCEQYLPIFEAKWPGVTWPRQLIGDVDAWHRIEGRGRPDCPDEADSADGAYYFGFDFLLCAYHYKDDPVSLAAGACGTMAQAAYARASHVWLADDPVAARIEQEKDKYYAIDEELRPSEPPSLFRELNKPAHSPYHNVAFVAVHRREWAQVAVWLRAEAVWQCPEPSDLDAVMLGLQRWEAHQFLPIKGPERAEPRLAPD